MDFVDNIQMSTSVIQFLSSMLFTLEESGQKWPSQIFVKPTVLANIKRKRNIKRLKLGLSLSAC